MTRPTTQLRGLLQRSTTLVAPGACGPVPAKLAEQAGFEAVYMPGGGVALDRLGVADLGLITLPEIVEAAHSIAQSVRVPVIADADTGFGNPLNVQRTVRDFERAGVAAIHIEDQLFPKRCGHFSGIQLATQDEAVQRIRAAVAARVDPDFMIIARCDALTVGGWDEVRQRCENYLQAGADMLFIDGLRSFDDICMVPHLIPGRHVFNMSAGGRVPPLTSAQLNELGFDVMILPNFAALTAIRAMRDFYLELHRTGSVATTLDRCASFSDFTALGGFDALREIEGHFSTPLMGSTSAF